MNKTFFVTAGTQLPFDRLIGAVDRWASDNPFCQVIVQAHSAVATSRNISVMPFMTPEQYSKHISAADIIVGHAGMGTIITAIENRKPLIIMPRLFSLGEHRNDHQVATIKRFEGLSGIYAVYDEISLISRLNDPSLTSPEPSQSDNRSLLIASLKKIIG